MGDSEVLVVQGQTTQAELLAAAVEKSKNNESTSKTVTTDTSSSTDTAEEIVEEVDASVEEDLVVEGAEEDTEESSEEVKQEEEEDNEASTTANTADATEPSSTTTPTATTSTPKPNLTPQEEAEEKAIAEATASADNAYTPSPQILSSTTSTLLLQSVDGTSLKSYQTTPAIYTAKSVPIGAKEKVKVPIHVTTGGSVVEYRVESEDYDIGFGIVAERDESVTIVMEHNRIESHMEGITGKFLVGTVPCALIFTFDNEYSWLRSKNISYQITVTPPSITNILAGRRTRASTALSKVTQDEAVAKERLDKTSLECVEISTIVERMEKELKELKKSQDVLMKEEEWLKKRVDLRGVQVGLLNQRLENGWEDELELKKEEEENKGIEV